jgi:flagellar assembly factor FliW
MEGYRNTLGPADLARLGAAPDTVLLWLSIVSFDDAERAFVNLRAPIVINPERMLGYQVMPHNSLYPLRHPLASE